MNETWRNRFRRTAIPALVLFVYFVLGSMAYHAFGHSLIQAMYEGESLGFLNRLIHDQGSRPLESYTDFADALFLTYLKAGPLVVLIFLVVIRPGIVTDGRRWKRYLEEHTEAIDSLPESRLWAWIALAAGVGLFTELMIIRIHASYFQLFAYYKNVSLLSCFLGLGIGYARGTRLLTTPFVLPLLGVQILFLNLLRFSPVSEMLQNPISEQFVHGLPHATELAYIVFAFGFLALIFSLNALCLVPLGQLASRLMLRQEKLAAYGWNLVGSLLGIALFSFLSYLWLPPVAWFALSAVVLLLFVRTPRPALRVSGLAAIAVLVGMQVPSGSPPNRVTVFSPYQILTLTQDPDEPIDLQASNTYYQRLLNLQDESIAQNEKLKRWAEAYALPYRFKHRPEEVLIVGSGTGNDVAAALRHGAGRIDAVEIDPAILQIGQTLHPEAPYQSPRVTAIVDDARAYLRHSSKKYDLIVYGLLDSHTLLSGRAGGIRLDSYVYTVEAFREARTRLKEGGVLSLTYAVIEPGLARKVYLMLEEAFDGKSPIVYRNGYDGGHTFLAGDIPPAPPQNLPSILKDWTARLASSDREVDPSTDDWPFIYMPRRKFPASSVVMIGLLLVVSILYIGRLTPDARRGFSAPCFFLGAGFMLVETKGITELALEYGSTWSVLSVVIAAILIMAFLANLLVMRVGSPRPILTYGLLGASLALGLGMTWVNLGDLPAWSSRLVMAISLTLPLFFSGFAFSTELKSSATVPVALSSNLMGAMLGGFLEYNSMYFGFRSLYILALVMYLFAFLGSRRSRKMGP